MKKFKKIGALVLAAVMVLGVATTADVQAETAAATQTESAVKTHTVKDVLIVPVEHESDPEFSSYYADMEYTIVNGELTGITVTSGFGPFRAEGSNVTYTVNALSQYIDWLQTGNGELSKLVSTDTYSGATSSLGRFGSVHVELPENLWVTVAEKVDIKVVRNSAEYTVDGVGTTQTITYVGYVENGERYGFADYKKTDKRLKKLNDGKIKTESSSSSGGHDHNEKATLDESMQVTYLGEEDGWKSYQITVDAEGYTLNTEAPMKYFFFNFTRFEAEEVDENMATFDVTSGLLKINMNCSAAMDEKAEVADGLTLAKITLSYVSNANAEETISGTAKIDLTESVQTDDEDTKDNAGAEDNAGTTDNSGTPDSSTTTTAPKTGDAVGNMYLVFAAGAIAAILAASRVGRRARA